MEYKSSTMFEMVMGALQRNTVYQALIFEQNQKGASLTQEEIEKVWQDELGNIGQSSILIENDVAKLYGDDVWLGDIILLR